MSKTVATDHEFNKKKYIELVRLAMGNRSQSAFARDCGMSTAYICRTANGRITAPPIPSTIKKIADNAANNITYIDLLDAAGYNPKKYPAPNTEMIPIDSILALYQEEEKVKRIRGIILDALTELDQQWQNEKKPPFDISIHFANPNDIEYWHFFIYPDPISAKEYPRFLRQTCYGNLVECLDRTPVMLSIVTASEETYNEIKNNPPKGLSAYVSLILVDGNSFRIEKEEYIQSYYDYSILQNNYRLKSPS